MTDTVNVLMASFTVVGSSNLLQWRWPWFGRSEYISIVMYIYIYIHIDIMYILYTWYTFVAVYTNLKSPKIQKHRLEGWMTDSPFPFAELQSSCFDKRSPPPRTVPSPSWCWSAKQHRQPGWVGRTAIFLNMTFLLYFCCVDWPENFEGLPQIAI